MEKFIFIYLFYSIIKNLKSWKKLVITFAAFLMIYVFSRYHPGSLFNGSNFISNLSYYGSFFAFFILLVYGYIKAKTSGKVDEGIFELDKSKILMLIWIYIGITAGTAAIRILFEFTPLTTIGFSIFTFGIYDFLWNLDKKYFYLKFAGVFLIAFLIFSPFSFWRGIVIDQGIGSYNQARFSYPGYNFQWQQAGKWARENTKEDAVFAHWWDYGYWVQSGFERATVTDGGNFIVWWNYLTGRHVLTGQSELEALKFLKAHNVTHLLIVSDEIGKYPAYSSIGSDLNYDRYSGIPTFGLDLSRTTESRNGTILFYSGGFGFDEDFIYQDILFPAGRAGVGAFLMSIDREGNFTTVGQPKTIVVNNGRQYEFDLKCVFVNDDELIFENGVLDGCLRIIPTISDNKMNPYGAALYLTPKVRRTMFTRLYLFDKESDYFKKVYDDSNGAPLSIYQGRLIGPIKIWEISYPKNLTLTSEEYEYYLRTSYADPKLMEPIR